VQKDVNKEIRAMFKRLYQVRAGARTLAAVRRTVSSASRWACPPSVQEVQRTSGSGDDAVTQMREVMQKEMGRLEADVSSHSVRCCPVDLKPLQARAASHASRAPCLLAFAAKPHVPGTRHGFWRHPHGPAIVWWHLGVPAPPRCGLGSHA
jgi:hypothetical protein